MKIRAIVLIIVIAFLLRSYLLASHLFFGPEQGNDFKVIRDIVYSHKLTLIGPKTDVSGVHHGPVYYYLASIPFAIFSGSPLAVANTMIAIQAIGAVLFFWLAMELTKKRYLSLAGALLYAVSFQAVIYTRWLSGQQLTIPLSILYTLSLLKVLKKQNWYMLLAALSVALMGQVEFINFYIYGCITFCFLLFNWRTIVRIPKRIIIDSLVVFVFIGLSTYILFDLRHDFLTYRGLLGLLKEMHSDPINRFALLQNSIRIFFDQIAATVGLFHWGWGALLFVLSLFVVYQRNKLILLLLIGFPLSLFVLRRGVIDQLFVGYVTITLVSLLFVVDWLFYKQRSLGILFYCALVICSIHAVFRNLPTNTHVFFQKPQPNFLYSHQMQVIDSVYIMANDRPFSIQTYTIPYFWQDGWEYLFWYKAKIQYHFVPDERYKNLLYVIIQKDWSNPEFQKSWYEKTVSAWGKMTKNVRVGNILVEEHIIE